MNLKMPDLARAFESAGFTDVRTLLSSGNVVFRARAASEATLQRRAQAAMKKALGQEFLTFVRSVETLRALVASDPHGVFRLSRDSKRVVTFLREPPEAKVSLPIEYFGARILAVKGCEVFSAYVPGPKGPAFMTLIERTFGRDVTTRTLDTVKKAAK